MIFGKSIAVGLLCVVAAGPAFASGRVRMPDGEVMLANYPDESLRRGEQGAVGIHLRLNRAGRVKTCAVTRSSGYAALDAASCTLMIVNARMKPFREYARKTEAETTGEIVWTLPPDAVPAVAPPPSPRQLLELAAAMVVCREQPKRGSLVRRERICLTEHEWRQQVGYAQGETYRLQNAGGGGPVF